MKNYLKVVALALAWAGIPSNAYCAPPGFPAAGVSFSLAADSTSTASYHVSGVSFTGIQRLGNPGGIGDAGVSASAGRDIQRGNAGVTLAAANPASGYSGFQPRGAAVGTQGGDDQVAANAGRGSEPKTLALVLAGLILMGSIVHRRIQQQ